MEWITEAVADREALRRRQEKLSSAVDDLWTSLCLAIKESIAALEKADPIYGSLEQDANNHHLYSVRYVVDTPNRGTETKKVVITLDASRGVFSAKYSGEAKGFGQRSVRIDLDVDGDVCLRGNDDIPLRTAGVARLFLRPFLFPELETQESEKVRAFVASA